MKPTKKKKNTYVIKQPVLGGYSAFELCQSTPLAVVTINGKPVDNKSGWLTSLDFPNPAAVNMVKSFGKLKPIMGEKLASTIIEYLDKETGEPVAMLFPTNEVMTRGDLADFLKCLNHKTRQDFFRQIKIRDNLLYKVIEKQNQK